jgi:hypothetical protein
MQKSTTIDHGSGHPSEDCSIPGLYAQMNSAHQLLQPCAIIRAMLRRTKIVATLGRPLMIRDCGNDPCGMDVARLNFSHGDEAEQRAWRTDSRGGRECGRDIGIMGDLQGRRSVFDDRDGNVILQDGSGFSGFQTASSTAACRVSALRTTI